MGSDFQEVEMNEFPEEQLTKGPTTPKNQILLKNMGNFPETMMNIRPSLLQGNGIETIEKKLEKINNELIGEREIQKGLYAKIEALRGEKDGLLKENEKIKAGYEKRIEGLKEELGNYNKIKLELEYKDQMYLNQKAFYEEEINRIEDEKAEFERNYRKLEGEIEKKKQREGIEEELWKGKYEALLEDFRVIDVEKKKLHGNLRELIEENKRKEEGKNQLIINYEQKISGLTKELFRNKPENELLIGLKEENAVLLKELMETKLKCINLDKNEKENMKAKEGFLALERENEGLKREIEEIDALFKEKNMEIIAFERKIEENKAFFEEKINGLQDLQEKFLLINAENERLTMVLKNYEGKMAEFSQGFIAKEEIKEEIDEIMKKFLKERELFEEQIEKIAEENRKLLKEKDENKGKIEILEEKFRISQGKNEEIQKIEKIKLENEEKMRKSQEFQIFHVEKEDLLRKIEEFERKIEDLQRKNEGLSINKLEIEELKRKNELFHREIDDLKRKNEILSINNKELEDLKRKNENLSTNNRELEDLKRRNEIFSHDNSIKQREIEPLLQFQTKFLLVSAENERLYSIIVEKDEEIELILQKLQTKPLYYEENQRKSMNNSEQQRNFDESSYVKPIFFTILSLFSKKNLQSLRKKSRNYTRKTVN